MSGGAPDPAAPDPALAVRALVAAVEAHAVPADLARALAGLAAPSMLGRAGGEAGLTRALTNELYGPLARAPSVRAEGLERLGDAVRVRLVVPPEGAGGGGPGQAGGEAAIFLASLALRDESGGSGARAWRLTGLQREGIVP